MTTLYQWSLQEEENAHKDPHMTWAENQLPATVNNGFRVMMKRVRDYIQDNSCCSAKVIVAPLEYPTGTLIRIKSATHPEVYSDDMVCVFQADDCAVGTTMIQFDHLLPEPVFRAGKGKPVPLQSFEIVKGGRYTACYRATGDYKGWYILNHTPVVSQQTYLPDGAPTGMIAPFGSIHMPPKWLLCDGSTYKKADYPHLWYRIGNLWGKSVDDSLFYVPYFNGLFLRGHPKGENFPVGGLDNFQRHKHTGETGEALFDTEFPYVPPETLTSSPAEIQQIRARVNDHGHAVLAPPRRQRRAVEDFSDLAARQHSTYRLEGDEETRPINIAVAFGIRT